MATRSDQHRRCPGASLLSLCETLHGWPALPHTHTHAQKTHCTGTRLRQGWSVMKPPAPVASDTPPVTPWSVFVKALPSNPGLLRCEQCRVHQVLFFHSILHDLVYQPLAYTASKPCTANRAISSWAFLVAAALCFPKINEFPFAMPCDITTHLSAEERLYDCS